MDTSALLPSTPSRRLRTLAVAIAITGVALPAVVHAQAGNDERASATELPATPASIPFDLADATLAPGEGTCRTTRETPIARPPIGDPLVLPSMHLLDPAPGLWYRFTAPHAGTLAVSMRGAPTTTLAIVEPGSAGISTCLTSDDHLPVAAGSTYDLLLSEPTVVGFEQHPATGWLDVEFFERHVPANDLREQALPIGVDTELRVPTFDASTDTMDCGARPAIWFRLSSPSAIVVDITLDVSNNADPRPTVVAYDASSDTELACDVSFSSRGRSLIELSPGQDVLLGVGLAGSLLHLSTTSTPIADDVADAIPLTDGAGFSTANADLEDDETGTCGGPRSVWFAVAAVDRARVLRLELASVPGALTVGLQRYVAGAPEAACAEARTLSIPAGFAGFIRLGSLDPLSGRTRLLDTNALGSLQLTDDSPLSPGCASMTGITRHSEVEPHLAISPSNPDHLVASWQQDRDSNGGALTLLTATSFDGGATWTKSHPGGVSQCGFGIYARASDPWVSIGSDGVAHLTTLAVGGPVLDQNAIIVQRSPDGGITWQPPVTVSVGRGLAFNDKQVLLVDPSDPDKVYLVWGMAVGPLRSVLARSLDGGETWLPPIPLPTATAMPVGDQLIITDDGDLVHVLNHQVAGYTQAMRSRDGGLTWSPPVRLGPSTSVEGPNNVRGGNIMPDVATDGERVYVTWLDDRDVWLATSDADALTWSARRIGSATGRFTPSIAVTESGAVTVTSYRFDSDLVVMTQLVEHDGAFIERIVSEPFDLSLAPNIPGRGRFLGDYTGLVARGDGFLSLHATTLDGDTDLYVQSLSR